MADKSFILVNCVLIHRFTFLKNIRFRVRQSYGIFPLVRVNIIIEHHTQDMGFAKMGTIFICETTALSYTVLIYIYNDAFRVAYAISV